MRKTIPLTCGYCDAVCINVEVDFQDLIETDAYWMCPCGKRNLIEPADLEGWHWDARDGWMRSGKVNLTNSTILVPCEACRKDITVPIEYEDILMIWDVGFVCPVCEHRQLIEPLALTFAVFE